MHLLSSPDMDVKILPYFGGRMVSLFDKKEGYEWLAQRAGEIPKCVDPEHDDFHDVSMFGWIEMFPTILACTYPDPNSTWKGKKMPDHGECWAKAWKVIYANERSLHISYESSIFPAVFFKRFFLKNNDTLIMEYRLENNGGEPFYFLWAPHPFFTVEAGDKISFPESITRIINMLQSDFWGDLHGEYTWPKAQFSGGGNIDRSIIGPPARKERCKFYWHPEERGNWASIEGFTGGVERKLTMSWEEDINPYFSFVIDEGYSRKYSRVSFEPLNGFYDTLASAYENGLAVSIKGNASLEWHVSLSISMQHR